MTYDVVPYLQVGQVKKQWKGTHGVWCGKQLYIYVHTYCCCCCCDGYHHHRHHHHHHQIFVNITLRGLLSSLIKSYNVWLLKSFSGSLARVLGVPWSFAETDMILRSFLQSSVEVDLPIWWPESDLQGGILSNKAFLMRLGTLKTSTKDPADLAAT